MIHGLKAWSLFGIRYIHKTKTDVTSFFFVWCDIILWQDIVVKREKTIRAPMDWELITVYWVKNISPFFRLSVRLFVRLSPWDHSGSVNSVNLFENFTRYLLIFFVAYPIFQYPLLFPSLHTHDFPSTEFLRMHNKITYPRFFSSTEFLHMYNKTNYSKIE
jgi:hypothetical protein